MNKYICECCGGQINPHTMKCEYCGTQYKKENEQVLRIETFQGRVQTFKSALDIDDDYLIRYPKEASEIAVQQVAKELASMIAPYCEYEIEDAPFRRQKRLHAMIKIVEPMNKGLRIRGNDDEDNN